MAIVHGMADNTKIDVPKLRRAILAYIEATPRMTRRALSMAASGGRNADVVRDIFRVDKRQPLFDTVAGLAAAMDRDVSEFLHGVPPKEGRDWLVVTGVVEAGVWKEQPEWAPADRYAIEVEAIDIGGRRYGLVVEGRSMDLTFKPGMILDCISLIGADVSPSDGDYVIVERSRGGLRETTCKRLRQRPDGNYELVAESSLPEFSEPMLIGKPDFNAETDDETRAVALVLSARLPLFRQKRRPIELNG